MIQQIFYHQELGYEWVDVTHPTQEDYRHLAEKYQLHPAAVKDCMLPMHLPKFEQIGQTVFLIARAFDVHSRSDADSIQQLTNKVAIFASDKFIITIHRKDEPLFEQIKRKWTQYEQVYDSRMAHLFNEMLDNIIHTYDEAIKRVTDDLDKYEKQIFEGTKDPRIIHELYHMKRRASVFKRMLFLTRDTIDRTIKNSSVTDPFSKDLMETADSLFFMADDLHENTNNLINLHLSLSSHRSSEVMNMLTLLSAFFLPLTFIAGVYGMNFDVMPELRWQYGYFAVWGVMIGIVVFIFLWFKRNGWL